MVEELKAVIRNLDADIYAYKAREFILNHGDELLQAALDSERMDQLELSQRADVYWHENGEQELAGYEWGCAGQYSSARDALDAAIDFNRKAASARDGEK